MGIRNFVAVLTLLASTAHAEIAVVVNPASEATVASEDGLQRLYLGKTTQLDGVSITALNQIESSGIRGQFIENVVGKTSSQYRAYWSQLIFTGKGKPPKEVNSDQDVKKMVADNPDFIGYIEASSVDDTVKVIFTK